MTSYLLEQYLERVSSLPRDLERNFSLMRELDMKAEGKMFLALLNLFVLTRSTAEMIRYLDSDCQAFLETLASLSPEERKENLKAIQVIKSILPCNNRHLDSI